jgi:hypothetical protein
MKKLAENDNEKKDKTVRNNDRNCPVVIVLGILRENRRNIVFVKTAQGM